jgi:hypothetical protein
MSEFSEFDDRLQYLIKNKDTENAVGNECWAICDGAMVIYDAENCPEWFKFDRNDDGDSVLRLDD